MKLVLVLAALSLFADAQDPWAAQEIIQPKVLANRIQAKDQLPIYYVGFPTLYRNGAHISGATLAGPCSKAEGLDALKKAVAALPRDKELFIYCGCCPFVKCPNIRPAYSALHEMGFSNVKVVMIETNLHTDWIEKGYPSEKTAP
jgi:thiosulfate/3-mercaptopyruvate sulfurtransferase